MVADLKMRRKEFIIIKSVEALWFLITCTFRQQKSQRQNSYSETSQHRTSQQREFT